MELLNEFIEQRPAVKKSAIANHLGVSAAFINLVVNGERNLTEEKEAKLLEFAKTYGFSV